MKKIASKLANKTVSDEVTAYFILRDSLKAEKKGYRLTDFRDSDHYEQTWIMFVVYTEQVSLRDVIGRPTPGISQLDIGRAAAEWLRENCPPDLDASALEWVTEITLGHPKSRETVIIARESMANVGPHSP